MKEAQLFVHRTIDSKLRVQLEPASPDYPPPSPASYYRVSPIFKVDPQLDDDTNHAGEVTFGFYLVDRAYRVVAELKARAPQVMPYLWFSHGLASLIAISSHADVFRQLEAIFASRQIASEYWTVRAGDVIAQDPHYPEVPPLALEGFAISDYSALPEDLRTIIKEFAHSLNKAVWLSQRFMPTELHTYEMLLKAVNDLITELVDLHSITPHSTSVVPETAGEDHLARQKMIHQLEDRIVQINSALSYLMSQSFAGVVPILQRECLIRNYSLLGIGTAVAGISALARHVERVFEATPIDLVIENSFPTLPKLQGWSNFEMYDVREWRESWRGVDQYLSRESTPAHVLKLIYMSGRLGFREAEFSVSSALQVLSAANTVGWSLMTLTHELLHGHVRELMSAIIVHPSEQPLSQFRAVYDDYQKEMGNRSERRISQLDSLRFIIFFYCEQVAAFGSLTRPSALESNANGVLAAAEPALESDTIRGILESEYRNISEIMVHVLDYYYFYNAQPEIYLPFIWVSWSKVPSVLKHVEHYLLRSILAVASGLPGKVSERFLAAVSVVTEQIAAASRRDPSNDLLCEALLVLRNEEKIEQLRMPFYPSVLIADVTANILRARSLHAALLGDDPNLDASESGWFYRIPLESFIDDQVSSPTAFLLGTLTDSLTNSTLEGSQRASAWIFLALASSTPLRGG